MFDVSAPRIFQGIAVYVSDKIPEERLLAVYGGRSDVRFIVVSPAFAALLRAANSLDDAVEIARRKWPSLEVINILGSNYWFGHGR